MNWSISIKTVGVKPKSIPEPDITNENDASSLATEVSKPKDFTVDVDPDAPLSALEDKIEILTGLKATQQRLIFRGRIINSNPDENSIKMSDIDGLEDGQTIHLIPRPSTPSVSNRVQTASSSDEENSSNVITGNSTASLLATLLGLGMGNALTTSADSEEEYSEQRRQQRNIQQSQQRNSQFRRNRRMQLRLEQGVPPRSEPGSLEPCRQGLMTLHTMLHHNQNNSEREWYKGQWMDCRDTVNQWLEATIVDIVTPQDILTSVELQTNEATSPRGGHKRKRFDNDPIINADDYDGRRRLLLDLDENGSGKLRDGIKVQLLLVHYNGWPHRWDEWIRSDSERIRPFRTRTRHSSMTPYASPNPQHVFPAAPSTFILNDDESDRGVILTELSRTFSNVENLIQSISHVPTNTATQTNLPWLVEDETLCTDQLDFEQLKILAPLLDRLGRTLIDFAPHITSLATSLENSAKCGNCEDDLSESTESPSRRRLRVSLEDSEGDSSNPDLADFVNGMVNVSTRENRRESGRGGLNERTTSANGGRTGNGAALLGSIFTGGDDAGTLTRLLRASNSNGSEGATSGTNGGNSGGIDIHIHAIVTPAPGIAVLGGETGLGFAMQPSEDYRVQLDDSAPTNTSLEDLPVPLNVHDDDDMGLFSELYSENPPPLSSTAAMVDNDILNDVTGELQELMSNEPENPVQYSSPIPQDRTQPSRTILDANSVENPTNNTNDSDSVSSSSSRRLSTLYLGSLLRRAFGRRNEEE